MAPWRAVRGKVSALRVRVARAVVAAGASCRSIAVVLPKSPASEYNRMQCLFVRDGNSVVYL